MQIVNISRPLIPKGAPPIPASSLALDCGDSATTNVLGCAWHLHDPEKDNTKSVERTRLLSLKTGAMLVLEGTTQQKLENL